MRPRHRVIPAPATDANHVRIVSSVAGNFGSNRRGKLASAARKKNEKRKRFCFFARRDGHRCRLVPAARVSPQTPSHRFSFNTAFDGAHVAAPYDLDGGNHAKTSTWNQIVRSPNRVAAFRSTTARLLPDPEGRIKSNFSRISENRKGLSFGSSSASGIIADHWRRTRGAATTEALGPGCYAWPERDRFGNRIEGEIGSASTPPRARSRPRRTAASTPPRAAAEPGDGSVRRAHAPQAAGGEDGGRGGEPRRPRDGEEQDELDDMTFGVD